MKEDILLGLFLLGLGLFLLKTGKIGGVVPFTREERPFIYWATIAIAFSGGIFKIISAFYK